MKKTANSYFMQVYLSRNMKMFPARLPLLAFADEEARSHLQKQSYFAC